MVKKVVIIFFLLCSIGFTQDIYFYVASSMSKPANEVINNFNKVSKNFKVILLTGGSGQLLNKIVFSKKGDLYLPASKTFKDKAVKLGLVLESIDLLYQTPVFGLSENGKKKIKSFDDIVKKDVKIALGNPKTMALGKIFENIKLKLPKDIVLGIEKNCVVNAVNVAQIVNYLKTNTVDVGIIFDSVAKVHGFKYVTFPERATVKDVASVNLLKISSNIENAKIFLKYLLENKGIFKKYGFEVIKQ